MAGNGQSGGQGGNTGGKGKRPEHRGIVKNPNNPAHEADRLNREKQGKAG